MQRARARRPRSGVDRVGSQQRAPADEACVSALAAAAAAVAPRARGMGRHFAEVLEGRTYRCRRCRTHLAKVDELVSTARAPRRRVRRGSDGGALTSPPQAFHCRYGKAYLFSAVSNVRTGPREERLMTTGLHTVADISCTRCNGVVGWKYVRQNT